MVLLTFFAGGNNARHNSGVLVVWRPSGTKVGLSRMRTGPWMLRVENWADFVMSTPTTNVIVMRILWAASAMICGRSHRMRVTTHLGASCVDGQSSVRALGSTRKHRMSSALAHGRSYVVAHVGLKASSLQA